MRAIERVMIVVVVLLLIAKMLIGDVDVLLFITLSLLTIYYSFLGFYLLNNLSFRHIFRRSTYRHISVLRIMGTIGASIILSTFMIGILFRLMEYEGYGRLILFGIISVATVIVVCLVKYWIRKDRFYLDVVFKFAHWGVLGLIIHAVYF